MGKIDDLRWKEHLEDHMEGTIEERIEKILSERLGIREKEATFEEKEKIRQEIRKEILNKKRFNRMYEEERHLDELQVEKREYDSQRFINTSEHMWDRLFNEEDIMRQEHDIVTYDIGGIHPNFVVEDYKRMAEELNIEDTEMLKKIIENSQGRNIDGNALKEITGSKEIQKVIDKLMESNNGNLNVEHLLNSITEAQRQNAEKAINTSSGFMDVAKKDLDARAYGVERKDDALNKVAEGAVVRDKAYYEALDISYTQGMESARKSEDEIKRRITLNEVELLADGVKKSDIDTEIQVIRDVKKHEQDQKKNKDTGERGGK